MTVHHTTDPAKVAARAVVAAAELRALAEALGPKAARALRADVTAAAAERRAAELVAALD